MRIAAICACAIFLFGFTAQRAGFGAYSLRGVHFFHESFQITAKDESSATLISSDIESLGSKSFGDRLSASNDDSALHQFVSTVSAQGKSEKWTSLVVDAWVAGKTTPVGYFIRYSATDALGKPVRGEAMIATDTAAVKEFLYDGR